MVTLVATAFLVSALYTFLIRQRKAATTQVLISNTESMAQLAFFIIGRDIRRAGSNPVGAMGYSAGAEIPIASAGSDAIQILADLNGNGSVESNTDENVTYQYIDDTANPDGVKDRVMRQSGNNLVIENVRAFNLYYQLAGSTTWVTTTNTPALIRMVRLNMKVGTGKINAQTNVEDIKEIQMDYLLRNFK